MSLQAHQIDYSEIGHFRIFATPPGGVRREITFFRGVPVTIGSVQTMDPFTDGAMQLTCPQITAFDTFGSGDLDWMIPYADIDVLWENTPGYAYEWSFEGFLASTSMEVSDTGSSVTLDIKGALFLLDNYVAAPTFPSQPVPYEILMGEAFDQTKHPSRLSSFGIEWPGDVNGTIGRTYRKPKTASVPVVNTKTTVTTFKVATFNAYGSSGGDSSITRRIDNVANEMVRSGAWIIGLQEISGSQKHTFGGTRKTEENALLDELKGHNGNWRVAKTGTAACPIYYRKDKVKPEITGELKQGQGKAANYAKFVFIGQPGHTWVINYHATVNSKAHRTKQTNMVLDLIKKRNMSRVVITADFNDDYKKGGCRSILEAKGFLPLRKRRSDIKNRTFESRKGLNADIDKNSRWIDDIYSLSGEMSLDSGGLDPNDGISDHNLIYAAFSFKVVNTSTITVPTEDGEDEIIEVPPTSVRSWDRRVPAAGADYDSAYRYAYLRPWGVIPGQLWTGFVTRSTGAWEPSLSGFIQGLLSVMFEEGGDQWSIRKDPGRKPVLYLRQIPDSDDPDILEIDLGSPGVTFQASRDFTQSANTIYGDGSDTAGTMFSKARVSPDGQRTTYDPFAYQASVWPAENTNPSRNTNIMPKEAQIKFPPGMDLLDAEALARAQMNRFADPGFTGTLTLKIDPKTSTGAPFPRLLIKAGTTIRVNGLFGISTGVLFHITESNVNMADASVSMTVDSKYRDQLTVAEVQARTRDALTPLRSLQVGKYTNTVQDLLLPWSYAQGSGVMPSGGSLSAADFFLKHLPAGARFPYEQYTKSLALGGAGWNPGNPAAKDFYIRIGKVDRTDASKNWSAADRNGGKALAIPIKMGQQGSIRLLQIAAYRADGTVFPVKFHASIYSNNGTSVSDMPRLQGNGDTVTGRMLHPPGGDTYKPAQRYPFFETAWEQVNENGEQYQDISDRFPESAGLVVGYGNFYEPAGFYPGRFSRGDKPTGLLVDEASWSWDLTQTLDAQSRENSAKINEAGFLYCMIYCDDQGDEEVFFMGRAFRQEPGVQ